MSNSLTLLTIIEQGQLTNVLEKGLEPDRDHPEALCGLVVLSTSESRIKKAIGFQIPLSNKLQEVESQ